MDITAIYKGKPSYEYGEEIRFTTAGSNAACGVHLKLDEEYLIGFLQRYDKFRASLCGLVEIWNSVTDDDKASVAAACEDDPCDGSCGEFQDCLFHSGHLGSEYLCADACEPTPCGDGEVCTFEQLAICSLPPCPPAAVCK